MLNYIKTLFAVLLISVSTAWAADSSIYIDQSGASNNITINQGDGGSSSGGNKIGGIANTTPSGTNRAVIYGNYNLINIDQAGTGDSLQLSLKNGFSSTYSSTTRNGNTYDNSFNYTNQGDNAVAYFDIKGTTGGATATNNLINVQQSGNGAGIRLNITGSNNDVTAVTSGGSNNTIVSTITGGSNSQGISLTGGGANSATLTQTGTSNILNLTSVGASNTYTVSQDGTGHDAELSFNGSSNTATISQTGSSAASMINLQSVGSNNTFSITTNSH
jgi:hypothetical protein